MTHSEKLTLVTSLFQRVNPRDFSMLLEDVLTPAEIDEIADRIRIFELLSTGVSQRDIAERLGTSVTTVSRGNRVLQYEGKIIGKYMGK